MTGGGAPGPVRAVRGVRAVWAVARYELALLARSQRWLPPLVLLGFVLVTATAGGPPAGDALAFGGAALVPVCAWLTRLVLIGDPPAARACLMAATGAARVQGGCLLAAVVVAAAVGAVTTAALVTLVAVGQGGARPAWVAATVGAGLVTELACALIGVALGAVANPPVLRRADAAVAVTVLGATLALVAGGSPASAAIRGLSRTPRAGLAPVAWQPLAVAVVLLLAAAALSIRTAVRRGVH